MSAYGAKRSVGWQKAKGPKIEIRVKTWFELSFRTQ